MLDNFVSFYIFIAILSILIVSPLVILKRRKHQEMPLKLGFKRLKKKRFFIFTQLKQFKMAQLSRKLEWFNPYFFKTYQSHKIGIFDIYYKNYLTNLDGINGSAKVYMINIDRTLPRFLLLPKEYYHPVKKIFSLEQEIITSHHEFNQKYSLYSKEKFIVHSLFTYDVAQFCLQQEKITIESNEKYLLIYDRGSSYENLTELKQKLEQIIDIKKMLKADKSSSMTYQY